MGRENIGIYSVGVHFPGEVRTNDWWPPEFTETFKERAKKDVTTPEVFLSKASTPEQRIQFEEMLETYNDPFRGSRERRIAAAGTRPSDMEIAAAKMALHRADISASQIDLIITHSMPSDSYVPHNAGLLQGVLRANQANTMLVDSACASFISALAVAEAMIKTEQAKYALLVFSSLFSRMNDWSDPTSVNFGDGAAAVVVGPLYGRQGIQAHAFKTLGELHSGVCVGPRSDGPWYEAAEPMLIHSKNVPVGRAIVLGSADFAKDAIETVCRRAGVSQSEISHFYAHQPTVWFNRACSRAAGLGHCQTTDTYTQYTSLGSANIPVNLFHAQESGQLRSGDLALLYACGSGLIWAATITRWAI